MHNYSSSKVHTSNTKQCVITSELQCQEVADSICSTKIEVTQHQQCFSVSDFICFAVPSQECSTVSKKECSTLTEKKCSTTYKQQCNTINEKTEV